MIRMIHKGCGGDIREHPVKRYEVEGEIFPAYFCRKCTQEVFGDAQIELEEYSSPVPGGGLGRDF